MNVDNQVAFLRKHTAGLGLGWTLIQYLFTEKEYAHGNTKACAGNNPITKRPRVIFGKKATKYDLLHELGHIRFNIDTDKDSYKKTNKIKLVDFSKYKKTLIQRIGNAIEDAFSNYHLRKKYKPASKIFLSHYKDGVLKIDKMRPFFVHLTQFIYWYLVFKYILPKGARKRREKHIRQNIKNMEKGILYRAGLEKRDFTRDNLNTLKNTLDKFEKYKDTDDYKDVVKFYYIVFMNLGFWDKEEIRKWFSHDVNIATEDLEKGKIKS